jgi:hypothetical protein
VSETVFRLAHKDYGTKLPLHWAYSDPFDYEFDYDTERTIFIDNREPGFQVWTNPERVVGVSAGVMSADGDYSADEYPKILIVEALELQRSSGEWYAVEPADVISVRSISTSTAIKWARKRAKEDRFDPDERLADWLEEHSDEVLQFLLEKSKPIAIRWVETMPKPRSSRAQLTAS